MKGELIGKKAEIAYNKKTHIGVITNETKNTLHLETGDKTITIIKKNAKIKINGRKINGETITKRPEDRIKAC
jgi:RNase P/RNase MRP subunit p29